MKPATLIIAAVIIGACHAPADPAPAGFPADLAHATQLVVVTTAGWDSTTGELRRFARRDEHSQWQPDGAAVPIVVGRTGLAWGVGFDRQTAPGTGTPAPQKIEGDSRSPAGVFPMHLVFGFTPADSMRWVHLAYLPLTTTTDCVDDTASIHYNSVVDRNGVSRVDWTSAEHMRRVGQYRLGAVIDYNSAPPVKGRGSCIFFHIWAGPRSTTAGCTALEESELRRLLGWLDPRARPVVVQLPAAVYSLVQGSWRLPTISR